MLVLLFRFDFKRFPVGKLAVTPSFSHLCRSDYFSLRIWWPHNCLIARSNTHAYDALETRSFWNFLTANLHQKLSRSHETSFISFYLWSFIETSHYKNAKIFFELWKFVLQMHALLHNFNKYSWASYSERRKFS